MNDESSEIILLMKLDYAVRSVFQEHGRAWFSPSVSLYCNKFKEQSSKEQRTHLNVYPKLIFI